MRIYFFLYVLLVEMDKFLTKKAGALPAPFSRAAEITRQVLVPPRAWS